MKETANYWDIRSKTFPGYREGDTYQNKMLAVMKSHGVDFAGKTVLDLGCGSGAYTLHMAKEAKLVTALDISEGMLQNVAKAAAEAGLDNITTVKSDWLDYSGNESFDIILCSLTPAVANAETARKAYQYTGEWLIHIGFAGAMKAETLDGLYDAMNIEKKPKRKLEPVMKNWLDAENIPYTSYFENGTWKTLKTYEEMYENLANVLEANNETPNKSIIDNYIKTLKDEETGLYISTTKYDVEMIIVERKNK